MKKIILFFLICYMNAFCYINIYPLSFDQRIDGMGAIEDYTLINNTDKTLKYLVGIEKDKDKFDMTQWCEIYPKAVVLKSGEKKNIKLYIHSPVGSNVGEYSTILNVKELEVPNGKNFQSKLKVFTNLKLKIYGYVGDLESSIITENLEVFKGQSKEELKVYGKLKNKSLRRVKLDIVLKGESGEECLISECRLRKNEELDMENLNLLANDMNLNSREYTKLNKICIYEQATGRLLLEQKIMGS